MLMPASDEFIALCRSQVSILTQGLGAVLSVVYLTEELGDAPNTQLIPLVAYPEAIAHWQADQLLTLLAKGRGNAAPSTQRRSLPAISSGVDPDIIPVLPSTPLSEGDRYGVPEVEQALLSQFQVVIPLMYEGVVMGVLVTARGDRAWTSPEQTQIEEIAHTLAIACVLDQRSAWSSQELRQYRLLQAQQQDIFDDLLHQFRNPLTALRTFGKLLLRRLLPDDRNRGVAESVVRESDRLQELLVEFERVIDQGDLEQDEIGSQLHPSASETSASDATPLPALPPSRVFLVGDTTQMAPYWMVDVLTPLVETAQAIAQDRDLAIHVTLAPNLPPVNVEIKALREVLNNLIDNAIKYTPNGGQIFIQTGLYSLSYPGLQGTVIADTGYGIPAPDRDRVFDRHYRGIQSESDIPGTGLGLAIARDLVHWMQGKIEVYSPIADCPIVLHLQALPQNMHVGTVFLVWLPELDP